MFLRTSQNSPPVLALVGFLLQNTYSGCFWTFATANPVFHLNLVFIADSRTGFCSELLWKHELNLRSSHWNSSVKKYILRNLANFTGKHLCWSLFLIEMQVFRSIKNRLQHRCFAVEFTKFLRTSNLKSANDCFWNLFFHLDYLANITFATTDTAIIRSSRPVLFCKKGLMRNFAKFSRKHQKRDSGTDVFLWILRNFS